jgi:outer membrane receptor protein involved in Fe transport
MSPGSLTAALGALLAAVVLSAQTGSAPPAEQSTPEPARELSPVIVKGERYQDPFPPVPRWGFHADPPGLPPFSSLSFSLLGPFVITAARTPQPPEDVAHSAQIFSAPVLQNTPAVTLDGMLRSVPDFSLFRRSDSLTANPTAQGVSLRGLGPSGASRSLVLLDGVPLNDPFGGWVAWTKVPREGLARAELIPGGGATAWGNASLGGVLQLFTRRARGETAVVRLPVPPGSPPFTEGKVAWGTLATLVFNAEAGDYATRNVEFAAVYPTDHGTLQVLGDDFSTDGFSLVAPERRGPIDVAAWSRHRWLTLRWRAPIGKKMEFVATARDYEEFRGNGTPYTRNGSREKFASFQLAGQPAEDFAWDAVAYAQVQSFASTFSSVNATRTTETPASDQFAVPATAFGAAWTGSWRNADGAHTSFGFDARTVRGETRENFTFSAGNFTRQRIAGGEQTFAGLFALHERSLSPTLRATVGARLDDWRESDGHRRETDRATGAVLRDDHYAGRDGTEFSPSAGLVWTPDKAWRVRAAAQQAFRVPTLNELYRPFRQGSTVVETNPDLRTERNTSGEIGAEWTLFRVPLRPPNLPPRMSYNQKPFAALTLGATAFWNDLHDAVDNVTLAHGPGTFPLFGTLAAGATGRQRLNVDRIRVQGLEFSATWRASDTLSFTAAALFNDATVRRAPVAPALVGNQVAQVPRHSASLGATWRAPGGIVLTPRVRWMGRQFEDDENTLILGEAVIADLGASRALTPHVELFLTVENLGNARLETGRSADGVVNTGTPRLVLGGIRGSW